jgi:RNA polymerase sigma-70 factor (ECF subfamily)
VPPPPRARPLPRRAHRYEIAAALDGLSAEQRRALELRVVGDLDFGAVCDELGISERAARMRVSRALHGMRSRLQGLAP